MRQESDNNNLTRLLNPRKNEAGRRSVLGKSEQKMRTKTIIRASMRVFSILITQLKEIMPQVPSDGRKGFLLGLPSDTAGLKFRADNRDITMRKLPREDLAKLAVECYSHVKTYQTALRLVEEEYPGIYEFKFRLWNADETDINSGKCKPEKVFSPSKSKNAASRSNGYASGRGRHFTSVIGILAAVKLTPVFMIVAGTYKMSG